VKHHFENHDLVTEGGSQLIDVTDEVHAAVERADITNGMALVYSPHTTCAVVINEHESGFIDDFNELLAELAPEQGDILVSKHRYSGFFETELDAVLKDLGVKSLLFTGCTTSVCVESTLRDAFYRDYRCVLLADCTAEPLGSDSNRTNHEASLLVIETFFGWVSDSATLLQALAKQPVGAAATTP